MFECRTPGAVTRLKVVRTHYDRIPVHGIRLWPDEDVYDSRRTTCSSRELPTFFLVINGGASRFDCRSTIAGDVYKVCLGSSRSGLT